MRLIDADALIQELCGDCIGIMEDGECRFGKQCGDIRFIRNAPTADPVKWIPVTERLPEKSGHYLVTAIEDGKRSVYSDDYFVYGWDDLGDEVVAWAELPEPWRGEE